MNGAHARANRRVQLALTIGVLAALALGSFWVQEVMRRGINESFPSPSRTEPDYYIEKFVFVRMSMAGNVRYDISGTRLMHYPQSDSYEIEAPILHSRGNPQSPMTMHAQKALVDDNNSKVHMMKAVQLDRPKSADAEHFHLDSEYMLFLPDEDRMQTDQAVAMSLGASTMTGVGMAINNATREFRLLNQTRASYVATATTEPQTAVRPVLR